MGDGANELQFGDAESASRVLGSYKHPLDGLWKGGAPHNGSGLGLREIKPHAAHAASAYITCPQVRRRHGYQFAKAGMSVSQGVGKESEVSDGVEHMAIEA